MAQGILEDSGSRKKMITIGAFVVVIGVIGWQVMGLMGGGSSAPGPAPSASQASSGMPGPGSAPQMVTPKQVDNPPAPALTEREQELMRLQQQTEAKYLAALNELQMLKIEKEIATTNKDIATARLDTITAQKNVVDLLSPAAVNPNYAGTLTTPTTSGSGGQVVTSTGGATTGGLPQEITYTVISVTQLESKWAAVLGYQGTLYQVSVGDILPPDGSKVISIDKTSVVVEKDGAQKKISLVPII